MPENLETFPMRREGDSPEFLENVKALALGVARGYRPMRLYVVRIDSWFGPHWLYFSGKVLGAFGIWKDKVTVPPFVPNRVLEERLFAGSSYEHLEIKTPLHIDCQSSRATARRIAQIDKDAAFLWFSSGSEGSRQCYVGFLEPRLIR